MHRWASGGTALKVIYHASKTPQPRQTLIVASLSQTKSYIATKSSLMTGTSTARSHVPQELCVELRVVPETCCLGAMATRLGR